MLNFKWRFCDLIEKKIAVAGATDRTGKEIVKKLSQNGFSVTALVRSKEKAMELLNYSNVKFHVVDFTKPETLKTGLQDSQMFYSVNPSEPDLVEQGINQIQAAKDAGVSYILRLSGIGADNEDKITLQKWHREVEIFLEKSEVKYTIIRPNTFMQTYISFHAPNIKNKHAFYLPAGDGKVSFIDIRDVAEVAVKMFNDPQKYTNQVITLTGKEALSNHDLADIFSKALNQKIEYISPTVEEARKTLIAASNSEWHTAWRVDCLMDVCVETQKGKKALVNNEIEKIIGRKPIDFYNFVLDHKHIFNQEN